MSEITNASPAGDSEGASASEPLSLSAAAGLLETAEREEREETSQPETDTSNPPAETGSDDDGQQDGETDDDQADEPEGDEGEGGDDNSPEDVPVEFDKLHGNTKLRLRDGSEITVGELKKRWGDLQELGQAQQTFAQQRQEFEQWYGQAAQQAQIFEQLAPQAIAALQAQLPELPEPPVYDPADPFSYMEKQAQYDAIVRDYNGKIAQMEQIAQGQQLRQQEQSQAQQRASAEFLEQQRVKLFEIMPDLRDDAKRAAFAADFTKYGIEVYDFKMDEVTQAYDPRIMRMASDAIKYQKLMASKPKPNGNGQPQRQAPPRVSQPGPRVSGGEAAARKEQTLQARIHKPGGLSMNDAVALLSEVEQG